MRKIKVIIKIKNYISKKRYLIFHECGEVHWKNSQNGVEGKKKGSHAFVCKPLKWSD